MMIPGQYVEIIGWPPALTGAPLWGLLVSIDFDERATVVLLSGTRRFPEGEIHQFPSAMLRPMREQEQERLI